MASVAADCGEDVSLVGFTQITRNTTVMLVIPILLGWIFPDLMELTSEMGVEAMAPTPSLLAGIALGVAVLLAAVGIQILTWLQLPMAFLLGAMLGGIGFGLGLAKIPQIELPLFGMPWLFTSGGQILLGLNIGEYWFTKPITRVRLLLGTLQVNGLTLLVGLGSAVIMHGLMGWDWLTALLATALGGSAEMVAIALMFDQDQVGTVTATHLFRVVVLTAFLPIWLQLFRKLEQRYSTQ